MSLNQEASRSFLKAEEEKTKKSDLVSKFKDGLESFDPAVKERDNELHRTLVNNEIDGVRYVVLNEHKDLSEGPEIRVKETRKKKISLTGEQQRPPEQDKDESSICAGGNVDESLAESTIDEEPSELTSPILQALYRSKCSVSRVKKAIKFDVNNVEPDKEKSPIREEKMPSNEADIIKSKPFALPLRVPPSCPKIEVQKLKGDSSLVPQSPPLDTSRNKRRLPSVEVTTGSVSPQLRRAMRSSKAPEEPKDSRISSLVPLDQAEHDFLVKCASGHWNQVYGLLLKDHHLVEKKDFMSGFTVLHWAAKWGSTQMLVDIMNLSGQERMKVDINAKSYGGYTPLHIAALHDQVSVMNKLVKDYGADESVRDNRGKKARHYLHKVKPTAVKEMPGESKPRHEEGKIHHDREEPELFPELSKGFHSISRLFQPNLTGHKKKHKQRPELYSLTDDHINEEEEEGAFRHRHSTGVFM